MIKKSIKSKFRYSIENSTISYTRRNFHTSINILKTLHCNLASTP